MPSQPQTGMTTASQTSGRGRQMPGASARPQFAPIGQSQNSPVGHGPAPRVPQIAPLPGPASCAAGPESTSLGPASTSGAGPESTPGPASTQTSVPQLVHEAPS